MCTKPFPKRPTSAAAVPTGSPHIAEAESLVAALPGDPLYPLVKR